MLCLQPPCMVGHVSTALLPARLRARLHRKRRVLQHQRHPPAVQPLLLCCSHRQHLHLPTQNQHSPQALLPAAQAALTLPGRRPRPQMWQRQHRLVNGVRGSSRPGTLSTWPRSGPSCPLRLQHRAKLTHYQPLAVQLLSRLHHNRGLQARQQMPSRVPAAVLLLQLAMGLHRGRARVSGR